MEAVEIGLKGKLFPESGKKKKKPSEQKHKKGTEGRTDKGGSGQRDGRRKQRHLARIEISRGPAGSRRCQGHASLDKKKKVESRRKNFSPPRGKVNYCQPQ